MNANFEAIIDSYERVVELHEEVMLCWDDWTEEERVQFQNAIKEYAAQIAVIAERAQ